MKLFVCLAVLLVSIGAGDAHAMGRKKHKPAPAPAPGEPSKPAVDPRDTFIKQVRAQLEACTQSDLAAAALIAPYVLESKGIQILPSEVEGPAVVFTPAGRGEQLDRISDSYGQITQDYEAKFRVTKDGVSADVVLGFDANSVVAGMSDTVIVMDEKRDPLGNIIEPGRKVRRLSTTVRGMTWAASLKNASNGFEIGVFDMMPLFGVEKIKLSDLLSSGAITREEFDLRLKKIAELDDAVKALQKSVCFMGANVIIDVPVEK
jgi:hypothetical protein